MPNEPTPAFCLRDGDLEAIIQPAQGGRLAELRFAGVNRILPPGRVLGFHGDTFWPSPQERFDWPPPATLDEEPYTVLQSSDKSATIQSSRDETYGFQLKKHFEVKKNAIHFVFHLTNLWDRAQKVAPWQVTRALRSGTLIWARGELFKDEDRLLKQRQDPGCYYLHEKDEKPFPTPITQAGEFSYLSAQAVPTMCKLFADAQGWLAHLQNDCLIVRHFTDINPSETAPLHGEIELYFNPELDYIEIENQGIYQILQPGEKLTYETVWHFHNLKSRPSTHPLCEETLDTLRQLIPKTKPS